MADPRPTTPPAGRAGRSGLSTVGAAVGRATVAAGLLLLAFAAFQRWGTGLSEARVQERLAAELAAAIDRADEGDDRPALAWAEAEPGLEAVEPAGAPLVGPAGGAGTGPATEGRSDPKPGRATTEPDPVAAEPLHPVAAEPLRPIVPPVVGQPVATLRIPAIDLDKTVVEGTTRDALRSGPGRYRGTAQPGQPGNVAIAGHRTTYGAPFRDIDRLAPGDPIVVETADGTFTYRVEGQQADDGTTVGHRIVSPEEVEVIADRGDHRLTLTACHPLYSARQRIVVTAVLDGPVPTTPEPPPVPIAAALATPEPTPEPSAEPDAELVDDPGAGARTVIGTPARSNGPLGRPAPSGRPTATAPPDIPDRATGAIDDDLGWQPANVGPTIAWAALTALVAGAAWVLGRLWRRWPAYLVAGPSFTMCLLTCFGHLDRLIPAA